jgi:hypothetical protein
LCLFLSPFLPITYTNTAIGVWFALLRYSNVMFFICWLALNNKTWSWDHVTMRSSHVRSFHLGCKFCNTWCSDWPTRWYGVVWTGAGLIEDYLTSS